MLKTQSNKLALKLAPYLFIAVTIFTALGINDAVDSDYAKSKLEGEN